MGGAGGRGERGRVERGDDVVAGARGALRAHRARREALAVAAEARVRVGRGAHHRVPVEPPLVRLAVAVVVAPAPPATGGSRISYISPCAFVDVIKEGRGGTYHNTPISKATRMSPIPPPTDAPTITAVLSELEVVVLAAADVVTELWTTVVTIDGPSLPVVVDVVLTSADVVTMVCDVETVL